jgi:hypothetical protein
VSEKKSFHKMSWIYTNFITNMPKGKLAQCRFYIKFQVLQFVFAHKYCNMGVNENNTCQRLLFFGIRIQIFAVTEFVF